jgi:hypothetical protein
MTSTFPLRRSLLASALALALAGCGAAPDTTADGPALASADSLPRTGSGAATGGAMSEAELAAEITSQLQACSYDGAPVTVDANGMASGGDGAGRRVVSEIMKYTGLPQNFDVMPHEQVPNAAAVILVGDDKLPHRVIAYNERFMAEVLTATANNDWGPVSIMAHEVAHHLSGHTIQPGGSQPPTELEADKFSGYVLYKMGAALADAQRALNALVPESDGPTHPGRAKRVQAVAEGWEQACAQGGGDCSTGMAAKVAPPARGAEVAGTSAPVQASPAGADAPMFPATPASRPAVATATVAGRGRVDVLPKPDANAIPAKFGKFVIDEVGLLDPALRAQFEKRMFDLAHQHQVEIVTIVASSLHGMDADDYAYAMMRQLRVGKLDVGNGAVLVVAPNEGKTGVAMGPGVMLEMHDYVDLENERLQGFLDIAVPYCKGVCNADQTEMVFAAADHIAHDVGGWDFNIRYQSLAELMAKFEATQAAGGDYDPETDPTWRKITRIEGKLVSRNPAGGAQAKWINDAHAENAGAPLHVVTADGRNLLVYANAHTEGLMTSRLEEGKTYVFIAREASLSQNPEDTLSFDVLSYDLAGR